MKISQRIAVLPLLLFAFACAHHRDVRPGADGVNKVVVRASEKERAERGAISQAEHYCGSLSKTTGVVAESTKYTGSMDEGTRASVKTASKVATVLGHDARGGGDALGSAGQAGAVMTSGDDYVTEMTFRCQ